MSNNAMMIFIQVQMLILVIINVCMMILIRKLENKK